MKTKLTNKQPADTQPARRAACAARAAFALSCVAGDGTGNEPEALIDLLTDLLHWCDAHNRNFGRDLAIACRHYEEEVKP